MRIKRNNPILLAAVAVCALAAAGLSAPGRSALTRILSLTRTGPRANPSATPAPSPTPPPGPDIWQRARVAHGWSAAIQDSAVTGFINFFNRSSEVTRQGAIKILRRYPDMLRVEISSGGATEVFGFDPVAAWSSIVSNLT